MLHIICYGEVLWDVFSEYKKIGGAPLNVATRLATLGNAISIVSRIGKDKEGLDIIEFLKSKKINPQFVQEDAVYHTGEVVVSLNEKGSATYSITSPVAWDYIEKTPVMKEAVSKVTAFIYGSLVTRNETSRETLFDLLDVAPFKVFDVNLRPPHYTLKVLEKLLLHADFVKFNDKELFEIAYAMGAKNDSLEQNIHFMAEKTKTSIICVTKGSYGAVLYYKGRLFYNKGYSVKVKDTVGAGDSFLAALVHELLHNKKPQQALDFSCAVGAMVAKKNGANPEISIDEISLLMNR